MYKITTGTVFLCTEKCLENLNITPIQMGMFQRRVLHQKIETMTETIYFFLTSIKTQ